MTKRIISLTLIAVLIVALCSVNVWAEDVPFVKGGYLFNCEYESADDTFLVGGIGEKVTEDDNTYIALSVNGKIKRDAPLRGVVPEEFAVMIDLCQLSENAKSLGIQIYTENQNGVNWGFPANNMDQNVWYTYLSVRKAGTLKVYRKLKDSDAPFESVSYHGNWSISGKTSNQIGIEVYFDNGQDEGSDFTTTKYGIDNFRFFTNSFVTPGTSKIEVTDDAGSKKISASAEITSAISADETGAVLPMMILFDKKGKIMYMSALDGKSEFGSGNENIVSIDAVLTNQQYEKLVGGTAEFYLWEPAGTLKPVAPGYRVTLQ